MNLPEVSSDFQAFKIDLLGLTGLAKDALHIHIGLAVFVIVRLCWRWRGGWVLAWLAALTAALAGEYFDMQGEITRNELTSSAAHWHDVWNTMLWPTILLLIGRWLQPQTKQPNDEVSSDLADQPFEQAPTV